MSFIGQINKPVKALTDREVALLLKATGEHKNGYRDHILFSLALATGLREHELIALNMGDLFTPNGNARTRVRLLVFKRSNSDQDSQEVFLSGAMRAKLDKYRAWKASKKQGTLPDDPVFLSQRRQRLSDRMARHLFHHWLAKAGIERQLNFHSLRHTACSGLYKRTKDLKLVQRFARHKSILSTQIYTHVTDDDLIKALEDQTC